MTITLFPSELCSFHRYSRACFRRSFRLAFSSEIKCAEKSRDDAETAAPSRYNAIPPEYQLGPHKSVYTIDFARKPKCHLFGRPPGDNKLSIETLVATSGDAAGGGSAVFGPCFRPCTNFDTVFQVHAELEPRA